MSQDLIAVLVPFPTALDAKDPSGPDALIDNHWLWPTHKLLPFHMHHPIKGEEMVAERWEGDMAREQTSN